MSRQEAEFYVNSAPTPPFKVRPLALTLTPLRVGAFTLLGVHGKAYGART